MSAVVFGLVHNKAQSSVGQIAHVDAELPLVAPSFAVRPPVQMRLGDLPLTDWREGEAHPYVYWVSRPTRIVGSQFQCREEHMLRPPMNHR
jgi:hypothetical protein